jgi:hypothetical protein
VNAGVGFDFDEDQILAPAWMNSVTFDCGDFHMLDL